MPTLSQVWKLRPCWGHNCPVALSRQEVVGFLGFICQDCPHKDLRASARLLEGLVPGLICLLIYPFIYSHVCPWCPFWPAINPSPPSEAKPSPPWPLLAHATLLLPHWLLGCFSKKPLDLCFCCCCLFPFGTLLPQVHAWLATLNIRMSARCFRSFPSLSAHLKLPLHFLFPCSLVLSPLEPKNTLFIGFLFITCLSQALGNPK